MIKTKFKLSNNLNILTQ